MPQSLPDNWLHRCQTAWAKQPLWRVLDTALGDGARLLHLWAAWAQDPQRPARLHGVVLTAQVPALAPLLSAIEQTSALACLRPHLEVLRAAWQGLLPGWHRLLLQDDALGRFELTLCVTEAPSSPHEAQGLRDVLRELAFQADTLWLTHLAEPSNSSSPDTADLKALAALCRQGTQLAAPAVSAEVQRSAEATLRSCGFDITPDAASLHAQFNPRWTPRKAANAITPVSVPGHCVVVGGGLAGASAAFSLAQRGWRVTVLDRGDAPAAGASGLPAGLVAPHVSPDDRALSRLTRSGVRTTLQRARSLLTAGVDWAHSGVLEHRVKDSRDLPPSWLDPESPGQHWSRPASAAQLAAAGLAADRPAHWHAQAGWVRPAALVRAMLAQPGITWRGGQTVVRLQREDALWQVMDAQGQPLITGADLVVLAAGFDTLALLDGLSAPSQPSLPLHALRGQIAWGLLPADGVDALPPFPVNGLGSLISGLGTSEGPAWYTGSTFERGCAQALLRPEDSLTNFEKLHTLLPQAAALLRPQLDAGQVRTWAAVRCTVPDRVPVVGPLDAARLPGLWLCTAMGARGITLATLCGELIATQLHGEPLPIPLRQARALSPERWLNRA